MRRNSYGSTRVGRLVGACAVIGALIAFPLAGAGHTAPSPNLKSFAGQGTGYSLGLVVDLSGLPTAAKDAVQAAYAASGLAAASDGRLPDKFPFVIDQRFIETLSDLGKTNHGRARLVNGLLSGEVVSADVTKMGTKDSSDSVSEQLPHSSLPLITLSAGKLTAAITAIPQVTSAGSIASIQASLESLTSVLPPELEAVFEQVLGEVNGVIATANTALDTALSAVATAYDEAEVTDPILGPVLAQAGLAPIVTDVEDLQAAVLAIPDMNDLLEGNAVSIKGLGNKALAEQSGSKAFADASSKLGSVQLLGLLKVGALDLKSHSEAAGKPGTAANTNSCTIGTVRLGASGVALDGKSLLVDGLPVPVPTDNILAVKGAVDQVLSAAGLAVGLCETPESAAAKDGTSASQTVSALKVTFAPSLKALPAPNALGFVIGDTPVKITIDPTVSTAASATVLTPVVAPAAEDEPIDLPRTGAGSLPIILIGSIAAAGGALFLMRHRLASLVRTK